MVAMRDMLANIQFREPQWEDNHDRDEEEWDWQVEGVIFEQPPMKLSYHV